MKNFYMEVLKSDMDTEEVVFSCNGEEKHFYSRPKGEWILQYRSCGDEFYTCSVCGRAIEIENGKSVSNFPFCHCGADMRGEEE